MPHCYIERVAARVLGDLHTVLLTVDLAGGANGEVEVNAVAKVPGNIVALDGLASVGGTRAVLEFEIEDPRFWRPGDPFLYDLDVTLKENGRRLDGVTSYFGMRTVDLTDREFLLNEEPMYLKLVLDQGFYPDGIYTAPTDAALRRDIKLSMAAGYNGARLHQKVFEPRFLYWADRLGYLCWGEAPDWGADLSNPVAQANLLREWTEIVRRDEMHPSIVAWAATNEQHPVSPKRGAKGEYLAMLQRTIKQL
ncbi:unnamed protein product, partial [marine sediment metagenome]